MSEQSTTDCLNNNPKENSELEKNKTVEIKINELEKPQHVTRIQRIIAHLTGRINPALMIFNHDPRERTSDYV